jgi:hypothetical protein
VIAGNVTLEGIDFVGTLHPYLSVNAVVGLYANQLGFTLQYDRRAVSKEQATDLFDTYMRGIFRRSQDA